MLFQPPTNSMRRSRCTFITDLFSLSLPSFSSTPDAVRSSLNLNQRVHSTFSMFYFASIAPPLVPASREEPSRNVSLFAQPSTGNPLRLGSNAPWHHSADYFRSFREPFAVHNFPTVFPETISTSGYIFFFLPNKQNYIIAQEFFAGRTLFFISLQSVKR